MNSLKKTNKNAYLLAIDIGNTETVIGVFNENSLLETWRIVSDSHITPDEFDLKIGDLLSSKKYSLEQFSALVLSSVVPTLTETISSTNLATALNTLVVESSLKTGIKILIDNPSELGPDRIVNALAANRLYGGDCIIVDFGTATTFDTVSKDGNYLGGAISPGIMISSEALFKSGARLLQVSLKPPKKSVGKNTVESLRSGIIYGFTGLVDGIIERMITELGWKPTVIATGGLNQAVAGLSKYITVHDPFLTLKGLQIIHSIQPQ
jgi:type III pantothenate kinase